MKNTMPEQNPQHTPGPWTKTKNWTVSCPVQPNGRFLVAMAFSDEDARLIAAAPELLAALENAIAIHYGAKGLRGECDSIGWVRVARAAIAKATR